MRLHHGIVNGLTRGQLRAACHEPLGCFGDRPIDRKHPVDDAKERVECRLNEVAPIDCRVAMEDLQEYFGVGCQALTGGDEPVLRPAVSRICGC